MAEFTDSPEVKLYGRLAVYASPQGAPLSRVLADRSKLLFEGENLVVEGARRSIVNLLRGNFQDFVPSFISVGGGGDLDQTTLVDTGSRVAPLATDSRLRDLQYRIPIIKTEDGNNPNEWAYVAVARPAEAISQKLNEFGVESRNGTLISHYITAPDQSGRATTYVKTGLENLVIRWTYSLQVILNGEIVEDPRTVGLFIAFTLQDGSGSTLSIPAGINPGSNTELSFPVTLADGSLGTLDVNPDKTVTVITSNGSAASLSLEEK